jgi:hypothetical protein
VTRGDRASAGDERRVTMAFGTIAVAALAALAPVVAGAQGARAGQTASAAAHREHWVGT